MTPRTRRITTARLATILFAVATMAANVPACTTGATEVIVVVDTDAPRRVLSMRALVSLGAERSQQPEMRAWARNGSADDFTFPASFGVVPGSGPRDVAVTLQVQIQFAPGAPGQPILTAQRTARFRFAERTPSYVRVFVPAGCVSLVAPPARCADSAVQCTVSQFCEEQMQTCGDDGTCVTADVTPTPLTDGGIPDRDAGTTRDVTDVPAATDACVRQCSMRVCGDDRCGGSCGTCPAGSVCDPSGQCLVCAEGAACAPNNPCERGTVDCSAGAPRCLVSSNAAAGSACAGGVCDGRGVCVACVVGASCMPTAVCESGAIACSTGAPVCVSNGNRAAGSPCPGGVCDGRGTCLACTMSAGCNTGNSCTTGTVACSSGMPVCTFATNVVAGMPCPGGVCDGAGTCSGCTVGMTCTPVNPCDLGAISCSTGSPRCVAGSPAPAGTMCAGGVCDGARRCVACTVGAACVPTNPCNLGRIACATGAPICQATTPAPSGTMCSSGRCDGSGACVYNFGTAQSSTVTVPPGVTSLRVRAWGTAGGTAANGVFCPGGFGGYVEAIVSVTPGETLGVVVGAPGGNPVVNTGGLGGTPGGGGRAGNSSGGQTGGGGGGFSGLFRGTTPLAIAGGGGGGGGSDTLARCPGGFGGGVVGGNAPGALGSGATQTAGGMAGSGGGTPGTALQGGVGGSRHDSGGGGGGGLFGGAGGNGASSDANSGGGGSGHVTGTATMLLSGTAAGPGFAASPDRGGAGARGAPGRVILTMPGM